MPRSRRRSPQSARGRHQRQLLEKLAVKTYTTLKPAVQTVKSAAVKGMESYLKATNNLAKKMEPFASKLPKLPSRRRRRPQ